MAMNFDVLNQQILPQIAPTGQSGGQQSGGISPAGMAQIKLAIMQDQRQAKQDDARLAGMLQSNELDLNRDARDERKNNVSIMNETNLTNANVNKINNGIVLDWEKFKVDKDISYKDYGLREREQGFTENLRTKRFGQEVKESDYGMNLKDKYYDHAVNMDNKRFNFDVSKYENDQAQQEAYRSKLGEAVNRGSQDVVAELIKQGNIEGASRWQNTLVDAEKNGINLRNPEEAKKAESFFAMSAPDVLETGKLSQANAEKWADISMSEEDKQALQDTGKLQDAATISWMAANKNNLSGVVKDPSSLVAYKNGWGPPPKLPDVQEKDRSDFLSGNFNQIKQSVQLNKQLQALEQITKINSLASGAADPNVMGIITDSVQAANTLLGGVTGFESTKIQSIDQAFEIAQALKKSAAISLATQAGEGNDPKANARMFSNLQGAMDGGYESIVAFRQSLGIDGKIENGYLTAAISETDPSLNVGQIRQKQLSIEDEVSRLERRAGRPLSMQEKIDYINQRGQ
jgi:hypothetical protein